MSALVKEGFSPVIEDLMASGKVSALIYEDISVGSRIDGAVVISKGSNIQHSLAESPLYVCRSRSVENCSSCKLLNHGCKAPLKAIT